VARGRGAGAFAAGVYRTGVGFGTGGEDIDGCGRGVVGVAPATDVGAGKANTGELDGGT
jgi:hypothetical protein